MKEFAAAELEYLKNLPYKEYDEVRQKYAKDINPTMVPSDDPNLGANALSKQKPSSSVIPNLRQPSPFPSGQGQQKQQPVGGTNNKVNPDLTKSLPGFPTKHDVPGVTHVFEWTTDYRANYEAAKGAIPPGYQVHHIVPRAVFGRSGLAQEWARRGITGLHFPDNLEILPQTQTAYNQANVQIQHSGRHDEWSDHAEQVLDAAQIKLINQYRSLLKVPDDVMEQTKKDIMQDLNRDLLDKNLGIQDGWVTPSKKTGMDRLSQAQSYEQVG